MQTNSLYSKVMMEHAVRSCAFNPDGTHLAVGMMDGSFSVLVSKSVYFQIENRSVVVCCKLHGLCISLCNVHINFYM